MQAKVVERIRRNFCVDFFCFENPAVYEKMWEKFVEPDRPQMTIWRVLIAGWIPNSTDTHSEFVILVSFPLQQLLNVTLYCFFYGFLKSRAEFCRAEHKYSITVSTVHIAGRITK